jgi:hypothetical protein
MNAKGAKQWMHHTKASLIKNHHCHLQKDPHILPSVVDLLETKMKNDATLEGWEFDASDFQLEDFYPSSNATTVHTNEQLPTTTPPITEKDQLESIKEDEGLKRDGE